MRLPDALPSRDSGGGRAFPARATHNPFLAHSDSLDCPLVLYRPCVAGGSRGETLETESDTGIASPRRDWSVNLSANGRGASRFSSSQTKCKYRGAVYLRHHHRTGCAGPRGAFTRV